MKTVISLMFGFFVVLAMVVPAEAQSHYYYEMRDAIYGHSRAYPIRQGRGYDDPRMMDPCFEAQQYYEGIRGMFHFHKVNGGTEKHFRACDPTENPIKTREAGVYGGLAGAGIGAVLGGKNGAMIGAATGAGGSGYLASRKGHDDCLVVDLIPKGGKVKPTVQQNEAPVSNQEQLPTAQSVPSPVDPSASVTWPTVNTTDFRAVVTDPNMSPERLILIPAGGSANLPGPAGEQPYVVVLLAPGRGSVDRVPGEIRPSQDLQGWEIVAR